MIHQRSYVHHFFPLNIQVKEEIYLGESYLIKN